MFERVISVNMQSGISQLHYKLTSSQFSGILSKWTASNGYFSLMYKMLKKHLWNGFLLYLVAEILQLVHEIAVSKRCSIKEPSKHSSWWRRLEEVFRLRLQKTSSRHLQDVLVKTNIFALVIRLQKTFSEHLQNLLF